MEGQLFRAVCLTLLMGTVLSCAASETSQKKAEADFTTTIPKEGLERDVEQVFYLGPSSTLQVIDETGKAKYLPEPSTTSDDALSEQYSVAYRFENGTCDFTQTLVFNDAFPGYTKPLWVPDKSGSAETEGAPSGGRVRYTFTTPPEEYLGGGLSFCVRFKTVLASGSESQTSTSTTATSVTSGETTPEQETESGDQNSLEGSPNPPGPPVQGNGSGSSEHQPSTQPGVENGERKEEGGDDSSVPSRESTVVGIVANPPRPPPEAAAHEGNQSMQESLATKSDNAASPEAHKDGHGLETGVTGEHDGAQLRRLSETSTVKDAFLTIVVHSGACTVSRGMSVLAVFLLTEGATLFSIP
uniref:Toxoplasma gondii family A protein n=1 Tax=Neospora caninum (strain Liverpool) TaxID=572307 RepID=F0JAX7_NEOCL|nr:hypothetical protein NCLIV_069040 [Neospora caninum Liverpool]CEL71243.1 TPA: hypothetical protein BN1204_069040 [Neospora caninum Liverpool]